MAEFQTITVAAVQATPVILDAEATVDKAVDLTQDAAESGARLIVFPECFVSLYPSWSWAMPSAASQYADELSRRMWESAVDVSGPLVKRLTDAARGASVHIAIGVNEREDNRPGTLYNTLLLIGPQGLVHRHRKTMPTMHERLFHGIGAGDDLDVVNVDGVGRVGGLICWENRMPLARWKVERGGPQIWVAPTADDSDQWLASMRHVAIESGAFVVSVPQYIPASAFPEDFPGELPNGQDVFGRGGAAVVEPLYGGVIGGPLYDKEGTVLAECDLRVGLSAKRWFDAVGHYSRADVLMPDSPGQHMEATERRPNRDTGTDISQSLL
jgi:nitrilase